MSIILKVYSLKDRLAFLLYYSVGLQRVLSTNSYPQACHYADLCIFTMYPIKEIEKAKLK